MMIYISRIFLVLCLVTSSTVFSDDDIREKPDAKVHPGQAVFKKHCAQCHDNNSANSPTTATPARSLETLGRMIPGIVERALVDGKMKAQASMLTNEEVKAVVAFVAGQSFNTVEWKDAAKCSADRSVVDASATGTVTNFGFGYENHRRLTQAQSGLSTDDFRDMELAWSLAFPNVTMMRAQPAIVGNTLFVTPVESQEVYAFNIEAKPCLQWVYTADTGLRTSLTYSLLPDANRPILVFGDMSGSVRALDATTGDELWKTSLRKYPETIITGTPQLVGNRVFASVSQFEIMVGANPSHECCKASGGVASLDATTGEIIWYTSTLPEAQPIRDRGDGQMIWGPSGAPVWTSPAIDIKRNLLYVGTGEANSEPAHEHTDAILALDLDSGDIKWSFQADADDIYLAGCWRDNESLNCPPDFSINRDIDFGASVIISQREDGSDLLLAGQKSSVVWALDPDNAGAVVWKWSKGVGTANGGIHWGMAYDGTRLFAPISDPGKPRQGFTPFPGLYALNAESGELLWSQPTQPECENRQREMPRCQYQYGFSAAPIVVDGAVVQGSLDGFLRVFDATTGEQLFEFDTIQEYVGANGVVGQGGSIDSASLAAANGMLFVNSGYGMFGQVSGNVLLAFKPKHKKD